MRKVTCIIFTVMLAAMTAGCAAQGGSSSTAATSAATTVTQQSAETAPPAADIEVDVILQAIRDAYGEDYLPNMPMPAEQLENEFGLTPDMYVEAKGEAPMISAHSDRVVVVRAAGEKAGEVQAALDATRERVINNEVQYPMNIAKSQAAQVVRNGDYFAFLMAGAINNNAGATEAEKLQFAIDEVNKGVEAFNSVFN